MRFRLLALTVLFLLPAFPSSSARRSSTRSEPRSEVRDQGRPRSTKCATCERDANSRIKRDPAVRRAFHQSHPCPATGKTTGACPGYVVDHIVPLKRGGAARPENMEWQKAADGKTKDRIE